MKLRGLTLKQEFYDFEITDCPVYINSSMVALVNKPNSPLLQAKSIVRGEEEFGLFESDMVLEKETSRFVGYLVYIAGFKIYNPLLKEYIDLNEFNIGDYNYVGNNQISKILEIVSVRDYIKFKSGNVSFRINNLILIRSDKLLITNKSVGLLNVKDIKFSTGLLFNGEDICFGDILTDGYVVLHNCRPMVRTFSNTYRDLQEGEYDDKVIRDSGKVDG